MRARLQVRVPDQATAAHLRGLAEILTTIKTAEWGTLADKCREWDRRRVRVAPPLEELLAHLIVAAGAAAREREQTRTVTTGGRT